MILYNKTEAEINNAALELLDQTDINHRAPGSRAKTMLQIFNSILGSFYTVLDYNVTMGFVSKASGFFLEEIGALLNCTRLTDEEDDNYRYRITNQVYAAKSSNETAVRLAALSVPNVVDVILRPFTFGTGSYSVHVITTRLVDLTDAVVGVQKAIDEVGAYGCKGVALAPTALPVEITATQVFVDSASDEVKYAARREAIANIRNYIDNLAMGEALILSEIIALLKISDPTVVADVSITGMNVNSYPVLLKNYTPYWDEKLYIVSDSALAIS